MHHAGFSPDYVDSLVPFDRKLYWAYFIEEQNQSKKIEGQYTALDDNIPRGINMPGPM